MTDETNSKDNDTVNLFVIGEVPVLNHVQLQYLLLKSLFSYLGNAEVKQEHSETSYAFPVNHLQRAVVTIEIKDVVFCKKCKHEIVFPSYGQKEHSYPDKCENYVKPKLESEETVVAE